MQCNAAGLLNLYRRTIRYDTLEGKTTNKNRVTSYRCERKRQKCKQNQLEGCIVLNEHNAVFARSGALYVIGLLLGPPESLTQTVS